MTDTAVHPTGSMEAKRRGAARGRGLSPNTTPFLHEGELGEDLYMDVLSSIPSSILILDRGLRVVFANRNFLVKSRKGPGEVLGKKISEIFPPVILYYTNLEENIQAAQMGKRLDGGEMEYRAPGLASRVYFYSLTPLKDKDEDGRVRNVMLFMDDVTEKKSLGERVVRAERHLASVVESANDLIVSTDANGSVMTWNSAAERILGFPARETAGRQFTQLFPEGERANLEGLLAQLTRRGEPQETEANMRAKGGQDLLIAWRFSAMREERGQVVALVGVGRDLTEKRQLELRLIQSAKMAALGEMAGGIAHEIRNPLAITSSAAQILLKKGADPELRCEAAQKIHAAAGRAATIIENLLRFARPSEGLVERVDLNSAVEDTLSLIGHQISLQSIEIKKRLAPQVPRVKGNKNQLQQVFMNIILNAYHAMPDGGGLHHYHARGADCPAGSGPIAGCRIARAYGAFGLQSTVCKREPPMGGGSVFRYGMRNLGGEPLPHFRSLLHDHAGGQWDGFGPLHRLQHRPATRRVHPCGEPGGERVHLHRQPACPVCRAEHGTGRRAGGAGRQLTTGHLSPWLRLTGLQLSV